MAIVLRSGPIIKPPASMACIDTAREEVDYREFVFRLALAICGERDTAEDVAQDVLLTLYRSKAKLGVADNPTAWVRKVTVRCATRHLRRLRRSDHLSDTVQAPDGSSDRIAVYEILRQLTPEHRAILGMAFNQGLSYREIGEALDIPEGTVGSRLNAAKKAFQGRWEQ